MKYIYLFWVLLIFVSCQSEEQEVKSAKNVSYLNRESVRLDKTGEFSVPCTFSNVDDLRHLGVYTDPEGREIFYLCDGGGQAKEVKIYFFDWQTKEPIDTLVLPGEGPYQVSRGARSFMLGISIIEDKLIIWDAIKNVFYQYDLQNRQLPPKSFYWSVNDKIFYKPTISSILPLTKESDQTYILPIGWGIFNFTLADDTSEIPSIVSLRMEEDSSKSLIQKNILPFPSIYYKGFYGIPPLIYAPSYVINEQKELLASFPLDPNIYTVSLETDFFEVKHVPSLKIDTTEIKPLRDLEWLKKSYSGGNTEKLSTNERAIYGWNLDTYPAFRRLPESNIYLRFVKITPQIYKMEANPMNYPPDKLSVMIMDKELNVLNEHFIEYPENAYYAQFIKGDKIYFLDDPASEEDEDRLYFNELSLVGM